MNNYRVLHIVEASFAGVGRHVLDLAEGSVKRGDHVDVAYGNNRAEVSFLDRLQKVGVANVFSFDGSRAPGFGDVRAVRRLRDVVAVNGPYDIVHGHASKGGLYARLVSGPAKRIYTPNAFVTQAPQLPAALRRAYAGVERALARRTDGLVNVSREEADHARAMRLHPSSVVMIPNGIPLSPLPTRAEARERLGLGAEELVVGFVGRLSAQKGLDRLLAALPSVLAAKPAVLAVVGSGEDEAALRRQCEAAGLTGSVRWLGRQPGQECMPAFDVLAVPSRYEGFPYVILEGLWAGVPVLTTETSGASALLGDGAAGRIVEGTPAALAAALAEMLADESGRAAMGEAARAVVQRFSVDAMVDATREFYARVLGAR